MNQNRARVRFIADAETSARMKYYTRRLKAVFANERKYNEISATDKIIDEIEDLCRRTRIYLRECSNALQIRDSMLKLTMDISDTKVADSILEKMPNLPHRYDPRPKVLDDALIAFMILGAYIKPDFSEDEEDAVRALPIPICVEEEIYRELASRQVIEEKIDEVEIIDQCPDHPESPDPEPVPEPEVVPNEPDVISNEPEIQCAQPPVFKQREDSQPDPNAWIKKLTMDLDED